MGTIQVALPPIPKTSPHSRPPFQFRLLGLQVTSSRPSNPPFQTPLPHLTMETLGFPAAESTFLLFWLTMDPLLIPTVGTPEPTITAQAMEVVEALETLRILATPPLDLGLTASQTTETTIFMAQPPTLTQAATSMDLETMFSQVPEAAVPTMGTATHLPSLPISPHTLPPLLTLPQTMCRTKTPPLPTLRPPLTTLPPLLDKEATVPSTDRVPMVRSLLTAAEPSAPRCTLPTAPPTIEVLARDVLLDLSTSRESANL